jgi:hypothetical protein
MGWGRGHNGLASVCARSDIDILLLLLLLLFILLLLLLRLAAAQRSGEPKNRSGGDGVAYRFTERGGTYIPSTGWDDAVLLNWGNGNVNRQTTDDYVEFLGTPASTM